MGEKTVNLNNTEINELPEDRTVLHKMLTENRTVNYAGKAFHKQSQNRASDNPGNKIRIKKSNHINKIRKKDLNVIKA